MSDQLDYAYKMGRDAGLNGPNQVNCNYRIFATPEQTKEWERGKAEGDAEKLQAAAAPDKGQL